MATSDSTSKPSACSVYVIQAQSAVKIGIAKSPLMRLKELQTGNHEKLKIAFAVQFENTQIAQTVETFLHHIYKHVRLQGEWFSASANEVKTSLELLMRVCDVVLDSQYEDDGSDEPEHNEPEPEALVQYPVFERPVDLANAIVRFARGNGMITKYSLQSKFGLDDKHAEQILLQFIKFRVVKPPGKRDTVHEFIASDDFHFVEKE